MDCPGEAASHRLMRAGIAALVLVAAVLAVAASPARADSVHDVRTAAVAAAVYADEHGGSYAGMTVASLHTWVNVRNVKVVRATRRSYCLQSISGRRVHFDGPRGALRYGACGVRGAVVPAAQAPAPKPQADWQKRLRNAGIAALGYYTDHGSYSGMTLSSLKSYDATVAGIVVAGAHGDGFCIETAESPKHHLSADFAPAAGACPAPAG
jgi:hypothetical protein